MRSTLQPIARTGQPHPGEALDDLRHSVNLGHLAFGDSNVLLRLRYTGFGIGAVDNPGSVQFDQSIEG